MACLKHNDENKTAKNHTYEIVGIAGLKLVNLSRTFGLVLLV